MYKVFINDKPVILGGLEPEMTDPADSLVVDFTGKVDLQRTINRFIQDEKTRKLSIINRENPDLLYNTFESLFTPVNAAGGIVFHPDKGILWIIRNGMWDLPKGKIDGNEKPIEAAIREVEEETGLVNLSATDYLGITRHAFVEKGKFFLKTSHWYKMQTDKPNRTLKPQVKEGITHAEWVGKSDIKEKINSTYASLRELVSEFVKKYTDWFLR